MNYTRRTIIGTGLSACGTASLFGLVGCSDSSNGPQPTVGLHNLPADPKSNSLLNEIGPLNAPDANDVMLPDGFTSRIIARTGEIPVSDTEYVWHGLPDGGAVFETPDGGWIYVSNSELSSGLGGVGAIKFNEAGEPFDAYPILTGTNRNCAGGATPWGTWLSCEEVSRGEVWECDPFGKKAPRALPALGRFAHEAVVVDPATNILYMTEDKPLGLLYRFVSESANVGGIPDLDNGKLEAAIIDGETNQVNWGSVSDPMATSQSTRFQVEGATTFNGGEGIVIYDSVISFSTKGDDRIWAYQTDSGIISTIYDRDTAANPILTGVDNITLSQDGELIIAEDGGDMQIVAIVEDGRLVPILQIAGQDRSEIAGPAFSPDGKKLYFSSQRGREGQSNTGLTYEITGPFHR